MKTSLSLRFPAASGGLWLPWLGTLLLWAALAASVVFWWLRWTDPLASAPAVAQPVASPSVSGVATAQWLGAVAGGKAVSPLAGRFKLLGVVTDAQGVGAALISADAHPARPYRVGAEIEAGLMLQKLQARAAQLGSSLTSPALLELQLPSTN